MSGWNDYIVSILSKKGEKKQLIPKRNTGWLYRGPQALENLSPF